jgi:hypothetical protein
MGPRSPGPSWCSDRATSGPPRNSGRQQAQGYWYGFTTPSQHLPRHRETSFVWKCQWRPHFVLRIRQSTEPIAIGSARHSSAHGISWDPSSWSGILLSRPSQRPCVNVRTQFQSTPSRFFLFVFMCLPFLCMCLCLQVCKIYSIVFTLLSFVCLLYADGTVQLSMDVSLYPTATACPLTIRRRAPLHWQHAQLKKVQVPCAACPLRFVPEQLFCWIRCSAASKSETMWLRI